MRVHNSNTKTETTQQACNVCGRSLRVRADMDNIYDQIICPYRGTMIDAAVENDLVAAEDWPSSSYHWS